MATIGLSKPYYAKYSNAGSVVTYSGAALMGKADKANNESESSEDNSLYADNTIAETDKTFTGGTLTLITDELSQEIAKVLLGVTETEITEVTGVTDEGANELIWDDDQQTPYLGVGMIIKKMVGGVLKWRAVVLTKVMFNIPADAATTQGESIEWQTPELSGTIMRDDTAKHTWKTEATFTTEAQADAYIKDKLSITK